MDRTYWHRQEPGQPLYADLLWSRPENKQHAGKLLVVGGSSHGFAAPAEAYGESTKAGVGLTRVLLPWSVKKMLPPGLLGMEFVPETPSGSFAGSALAELLDASAWADATILAGDFGRNSETAILLEKFLQKYHGRLTLVQDAVDYFIKDASHVLARPETTLVLNMSQLQKLAVQAKFITAFTSQMDFLLIIDALHEFSKLHAANIILEHNQTVFVAVNGEVSTTKQADDADHTIKIAAHAAVWGLQNPTKQFEALTTSIV
ncbi:MAG: hypothetical protein JWO35_94 [Candidatus Saccharibacteria bacterium]|nr:hypothetical protein [Candidatus Saccharibacteria bacterium]